MDNEGLRPRACTYAESSPREMRKELEQKMAEQCAELSGLAIGCNQKGHYPETQGGDHGTYDYDLGVIGGGSGGLTVTAGAAQLGAGPIGLLATMALILRGLHVCTFARTRPPYRNAELLAEIGGCYHSTKDVTLTEASGDQGGFDIIFEATGQSPLVFEAMNILGENRVLMLSNVTGGGAVKRRSCLRKRRGDLQP